MSTPLTLSTNEGRRYTLGKDDTINVTFKADGAEVANQYAITEWWLEAGAPSIDPHVHDVNDELIYVLSGPVEVMNGEDWQTLNTGSLAIIPAGTLHGFRNTSDQKVGILNILLNGAYEAMMPQLQAMFAAR